MDKPRLIVAAKSTPAETAVTLSHELGHLLGMHHDWKVQGDRSSLTCANKGTGEFILNYRNTRSIWSGCSNDDFKTYYEKVVSRDGDFCLRQKGKYLCCILMLCIWSKNVSSKYHFTQIICIQKSTFGRPKF